MICADLELTRLDRDLAGRYRLNVARDPGDEARIDRDQADFLNARERCATPECVARLTYQRSSELDPGDA